MTVNYQLDVASGNHFLFLKLLTRWRGSIWKSVIYELLLWLFVFYSVYYSYNYAFTTKMQRLFESISIHLNNRMNYLPLTFMLGFFVTTVFERWRSALNVMPFIESVALSVSALIPGKSEEERLLRRSIIRYVILHQILIFRDISMQVRRRFPTLQYVVDAGFMTDEELDIIETSNCNPGQKYWVPINWTNSLIVEAYQKKIVDQITSFHNLIFAVKEFRVSMETLTKFDQIPIPIAYPQVVFLAVRVYFLICIVSRQFLLPEFKSETQMDFPFPIMTILEFIFVIGWMKVAEVLLNPLGEDDDDFEVNWIIDKNISTGMAIVDTTHGFHPVCIKDKFTDPDYQPQYSTQSQLPRTLTGSAAKVELAKPEDEVKMVKIPAEKTLTTAERKTIFRRKTISSKPTRATSMKLDEESPEIERKFNLTMPAGKLSSKKTDRPTLAILNEEFESPKRGHRVYSSDLAEEERKNSEEESEKIKK